MITPNQEAPDLAKALGIERLFLKREDLHPYQSHKGRSIPTMIDTYIDKGKRNFAVSSSGNAAIAAALHVDKISAAIPSITLKIILGENTDAEKASIIKTLAKNNPSIIIETVERPLQTLKTLEGEGYTSLRQSTDDLALEGYKELALELLKIEDLQAVFLACSSGTTTQALFESFAQNEATTQIHIGQTTSCHPFVTEAHPETPLDSSSQDERSIAGAIVDKVGLRKTKVISNIKTLGGDAYVVTDKEITSAIDLVRETEGLTISANSAISVAVLVKTLAQGWRPTGSVVCLICGR
jgi:threonine synthase